MRRVRRMVVAAVGLLIAGGLALHIAQVAAGDRLIVAGLIALTAIPIANVLVVLGQEVQRRQWTFVAAAAIVMAELVFVVFQ